MWQVIQFVSFSTLAGIGGLTCATWLSKLMRRATPDSAIMRADAVMALRELGMSYSEAWDIVYEFQQRIGAE